MTTILERIIVWIIVSIIAVGAWMLMTSFAMGANNFPVPVLAESENTTQLGRPLRESQLSGEARESTSRTQADRNPMRTLAAGDSFRSVVSSAPSLPRDFLATTSRLASSERVPAGSIYEELTSTSREAMAKRENSICRNGQLTAHAESAGSRLAEAARHRGGYIKSRADSFLDAIERIESNGNPQAVGDKGRARGPYQFWATAWADCSRARSKQGLSVADYWSATNCAVARQYAATYLGMLTASLTPALRRPPTHSELWASWNLGYRAFQRRGFNLARCPVSTQKAAARINSMLANSQGGAASQGQMRIGASVAGARR